MQNNKKKALGKGLGAIFKSEGLKKTAEEQVSVPRRNVENTETVVISSEAREEALAVDRTEQGQEQNKNGILREQTLSFAADPGHSAEKKDDVSRETLQVKLSLIEPNRNQPRKKFDEESLRELAASMEKYGVLQPLLVKQNGLMYEIIAGERRWRAAKLAGLREVPVIVKDFAPQERAEIAIIENIQREDLGPVEEAKAYQALIDEYGLTQEEVAEKVAKNRSTITNSLRLLQLCEPVLELLSAAQLTAGHARCLIPITDTAMQEQLAREIIERKLSVRETEKLAKQISSGKKRKKEDEEEKELDMYLIDIARKLTARLNTKVLIRQGSRGKGKILIDYYSNEDLEKIIGKLRQ